MIRSTFNNFPSPLYQAHHQSQKIIFPSSNNSKLTGSQQLPNYLQNYDFFFYKQHFSEKKKNG